MEKAITPIKYSFGVAIYYINLNLQNIKLPISMICYLAVQTN